MTTNDDLEHVVFGGQLANAVGRTVARLAGYGGCLEDPDKTVTVYATHGELGRFSDALRAAVGPPEGRYRVVAVDRSLAELDALRDRIAADHDAIVAAGVELSKWGPDPRTNTVKVAVLSSPTDAARHLEDRYGRDLFTVEHTAHRYQTM